MSVFRYVILLVFLAFPAFSQHAKQTESDRLTAEFTGLISDKARGFPASQGLLDASFALHLYGPDDPKTVADLSALHAGYDPESDTRFTAGLLYFHLARPIAILRELGGGRNEVLAQTIEIRLRWLSGDAELALQQANALISLMDAPGANWSDGEMTPLLSDAAVLSYRAGDSAAAGAYFTRAMVCGAPRCPGDQVFGWLGTDRKPSDVLYDAYDPKAMLFQAQTDAPRLFPGNSSMVKDIAFEFDLQSDGSHRVFSQALDMATAAEPGTLRASDQAHLRQLAERLVRTNGHMLRLMNRLSVGGFYPLNAAANGKYVPSDPADIGYLKTDSREARLLTQTMPLVHALLRQSDRRGDDVVAKLIRIRLLLANGQRARGLAALQMLAATGRARGFSDAEMFSVQMDIWAVATLTGDTKLADQLWRQTESCRETPCAADLVVSFFTRAAELPRIAAPDGLEALSLAAADLFVRKEFPDNRLILADIYRTGRSLNFPMDAARNDVLSLGFAESARGITPADLADRAQDVMDTLVYAGRYGDAAAVGDRIEARLLAEGAGDALSGAFYGVRARAAFRVDDPRSYDFYAEAIRRGGAGSLALDLLDTGYLDLLEQVATDQSIRARMRYRQGRYVEAGDLLQQERQELEAKLTETGTDVETDRDAIYTRYWDIKALALQEAFYREAGGDHDGAQRLRDLGGPSARFSAEWAPLGATPEPEVLIHYQQNVSSYGSYYEVSDIFDLRDRGNYQAAAYYLKSFRWVAVGAEATGTYLDSMTLWQMAFTFARVGETEIAFDLMNRAARIAATLSFEGAGGAGGGTLQWLERDRWRYLLFVDIAWAAVSGQAPEDMLVVSRY